jgi:transcriptional antiterminator NusG
MTYYAIQVKTRNEERFIKLYKSRVSSGFEMYFPKRQLEIRRGGKQRMEISPIFPGYVFFELTPEDALDSAPAADIVHHLWELRRVEGFYRFLRSNDDICSLQGKVLETVAHFIQTVGSVAGVSRVYFDADARIVVKDGPLSGLEGQIIKVDRRKKRAKVKLDLYDDSFTVDLAFELIEAS